MNVLFTLCLLLATWPAHAAQRLVLIGGGKSPPEALSRFVAWSGGRQARILIIAWAAQHPQVNFMQWQPEFAPFGPSLELAPALPLTKESKRKFISQLKAATGVFFTGGDQIRTLEALKDQELVQALRERYAQGCAFAGNSAGTAVMSPVAMTGEGDFETLDGAQVETAQGLGLLPGSVVDQHFIKRRRENRLFALVLRLKNLLGIGIDENTALAVEDNRYAEVLGRTQVLVVQALPSSKLSVDVLTAGDRYDLKKRERLPPGQVVP